jgi:hypothetical protein
MEVSSLVNHYLDQDAQGPEAGLCQGQKQSCHHHQSRHSSSEVQISEEL